MTVSLFLADAGRRIIPIISLLTAQEGKKIPLASWATFIGIIILMVINLAFTSKWSDKCLTQLIFAWLAAMFEMTVLFAIGKFLWGFLVKLLGVVGKIIVIVLAVVVVLAVVGWIIQLIQSKNGTSNAGETDGTADAEETDGTADVQENAEAEQEQPDSGVPATCPHCGKPISTNAKFCNFCGGKIEE